ncbi:type I phosphomannose isomerase catalytic subunit [Deinococcus aerophilus]|uniref:Mannose-6-phosphate isomerase n=1 Tax=Deinococcus aerophilus TaxID=522488 RepID=A0ABQ2GLG6_9DEIO|nr:type I phosphomannose isomerase catalytic subunit [Deinococcus aerophilus]GGM01196.1 mannose-6-phosphate isomerase [Deinococcus aerophilus]
MNALTHPLRLSVSTAARVWGGTRLGRAQDGSPLGEAWMVHEDSRVQGGPLDGQRLGDLAREHGGDLLGRRAHGIRFPLLIKLLDCAEWLSVQVHPDDAQAAQLVGPGELGKTEAWYILDAAPQARVIAGVREGTQALALRNAILSGQVMDHAAYHGVQSGDALLVPAGTLHALGPGLFLYEVQQTSDTTYRVYDWDRPASAGRALHLTQSAAVTAPRTARVQAGAPLSPGERRERVRSGYFVLEDLRSGPEGMDLDTRGESFHVLTVIHGEGRVIAGGETWSLGPLDTLLLPARLGAYRLEGDSLSALLARLP